MSLLQVAWPVLVAVVAWTITRILTSSSRSRIDVAGPEKDHWFKGNFHQIFQDGLEYNLQLLDKYGGAVKIHALLGDEQLYVSDPRALHNIVVKEQHVYEETDMFIMTNKIIFGEGLISTLGAQHKKQRKMLNPVFSLANMRDLLPIIQPIADKLRTILMSELPPGDGSKEVDLVPWMSRAALEYISQAALGYTFNTLDSNKPSEYADAVRTFSPIAMRIVLLRPFIPFVVRNFSLFWRNKMVDWLPIQPLRDLRRIIDIMDNASRRIYAAKKASLEHQEKDADEPRTEGNLGSRMKGRDIMSILLRANSSSSESDRLSEDEILGQMNTIIFAGFETTAVALSRILFILASKPEVQARLRSEIRKAKIQHASSATGSEEMWEQVELPYDVLMGLPYLDAIVRETMRVHPPTSLLSRMTRQDTVLPLEFPVRSATGAEITSIPLPKDTTVIISILAANHNKRVWGEDASVWRPERWLTASGERIRPGKDLDGTLGDDENLAKGGPDGMPGSKNGVKYPGVYASMMTFLGGGRACIGFKFAEMEIKQVLTTLLSTLHFSLPSEVDAQGNIKEIYWKMNGLQVPVVRPPAGDNVTPRVPLTIRMVNKDDF